MRGFEGEATSAAPDTTNVFAYAIVHADARLLTLEVAGSVFCGGAHPSNRWSLTMLDLASGRVVRGTDLVPPSRRAALLRLVRTHIDGRPSSRDVEAGDCPLFVDAGDGRTEPVAELGYAVVDGRFTVVQTDHPHVSAACNGPQGTLPRTRLRGLVPPWVLGSLRR